ncbi:MAG: Holliday junction resolvase-like protein [Candidatus Aenigmatarchaeota archaeon]
MNDFLLFLHENRHIFSVCPECHSVNRLSDLQLSEKGYYKPDWLDGLQVEQQRLGDKIAKLDEKKKDLQRVAKEKAERIELPKVLNRLAPFFTKHKIDPRDVRTIFDPVEFLVFQGMNSPEGVDSVTLLHLGENKHLIKSIEDTIAKKDFGWNTIQVKDDGSVSEDPLKIKI